jgi:dTDP-4-dehydrorhamnose 3,5-epimerase
MTAVVETGIPGCVELRPPVHRDARGRLVKPFHRPTLRDAGFELDLAELYYSVSRRDVVRGLHCQLPPHDHAKLVFCTGGAVYDVALDLRVGSPTYGEHRALTLSADDGNALYVPHGVAHGFCALSDDATLVYLVSSAHAPAHDGGVRWDSAGIAWPATDPTVSDRDRALPALADFASPFRYDGP